MARILLYELATILLISLISKFTYDYALATSSPSFPRSIMNDENVDTIDRNRTLLYEPQLLPIDISSISFLSDARFLNATFWLSSPLEKENFPRYANSNISFQMSVYIEGDKDGESQYDVAIMPQSNGSWTYTIKEYAPFSEGKQINKDYRILERKVYSDTDYFVAGVNYVDLSLDLDKIGFPSDYIVGFFSTAYNNYNYLVDTIQNERVPPRSNAITFTLPEPLQLDKGEENIVNMSVNAIDLNEESIVRLSDGNVSDNSVIQFSPNSIDVPLNGSVNAKMSIRVLESMEEGDTALSFNVNVTGKSGIESLPWKEEFDATIVAPDQIAKIMETISSFLGSSPVTYTAPTIIALIVALPPISNRIVRAIQSNKSDSDKNTKSDPIIGASGGIITGVLIFLTFADNSVFSRAILLSAMTATIVIPFAISIIILITAGDKDENKIKAGRNAVKFMVIGFAYLIPTIIVSALVR
jgi:hypothetical protein